MLWCGFTLQTTTFLTCKINIQIDKHHICCSWHNSKQDQHLFLSHQWQLYTFFFPEISPYGPQAYCGQTLPLYSCSWVQNLDVQRSSICVNWLCINILMSSISVLPHLHQLLFVAVPVWTRQKFCSHTSSSVKAVLREQWCSVPHLMLVC